MAGRITQQFIETLVVTRNPNLRVTQEFVETMVSGRVCRLRTSQMFVEVLVLGFSPAVPTGRKYGPALQVMH